MTRAGGAQECLHGEPGVRRDQPQAWPLVDRQLHRQVRRAAAQHRAPQQHRHPGGGDDAEAVQGEQHQPGLVRREEGRQHHHVDRQARRTRHQWRHGDGRQPVALVGQDATGDDARDRAGEAAGQRHEALAGQADLAQHEVEQEHRARHVAGGLDDGDERDQQRDLRHEHQRTADAVDDTVDEEAVQRPFGHDAGDQVLDQPLQRLDPTDHRFGDQEHQLQHRRYHGEQHQRSEQRMQQYGVESIGARTKATVRIPFPHAVGPLPHAAGRTQVGASLRRRRCLQRRVRQQLPQRRDAVAGAAVHHLQRQAECLLQAFCIHREALLRGDIDLAEGHHHRQAERAHVVQEAQLDRQLGGVEHDTQQVRRRSVGAAQERERHPLVATLRRKRADARQVDDPQHGGADLHVAGDRLDRRAGEVDGSLQAAGQVHQERCLAGIGAADQRHRAHARGGGGHDPDSVGAVTRTADASSRRRASR